MSTDEIREAGAFLEDAVAAVLLDEIDKQRYTRAEIQHMTGVKSRTWNYYFTSRERSIPTPTLVAVAEALGLTGSKVLRRAEDRIADLDPADRELMTGLSPRARVVELRRYERARYSGRTADDTARGA